MCNTYMMRMILGFASIEGSAYHEFGKNIQGRDLTHKAAPGGQGGFCICDTAHLHGVSRVVVAGRLQVLTFVVAPHKVTGNSAADNGQKYEEYQVTCNAEFRQPDRA